MPRSRCRSATGRRATSPPRSAAGPSGRCGRTRSASGPDLGLELGGVGRLECASRSSNNAVHRIRRPCPACRARAVDAPDATVRAGRLGNVTRREQCRRPGPRLPRGQGGGGAGDGLLRGRVSATAKADGSPVTEADRDVERLLRTRLAEERPEDACLGEEFGRRGASDRVWVLDPIDGTGFFSRRETWHWRDPPRPAGAGDDRGRAGRRAGTAALLVGRPRRRRLRVVLAAENGATPQRLRVSAAATIDEARLTALDDASRARLPQGAPTPPTGPLPLVELVRGEVDAFLAERYHLWDHAPWISDRRGSGRTLHRPHRGPGGDQGGGLYSNAALHEGLLSGLDYPRS